MLTKEAFNALLKTLEEPPEHVKFIFATTEPQKIPITILSRCQRFDFAGISSAAIQARLAQIAAAEGVEVEPEALQILASRAAGSMRDSQSLLGATAGGGAASGSRPHDVNQLARHRAGRAAQRAGAAPGGARCGRRRWPNSMRRSQAASKSGCCSINWSATSAT